MQYAPHLGTQDLKAGSANLFRPYCSSERFCVCCVSDLGGRVMLRYASGCLFIKVWLNNWVTSTEATAAVKKVGEKYEE